MKQTYIITTKSLLMVFAVMHIYIHTSKRLSASYVVKDFTKKLIWGKILRNDVQFTKFAEVTPR